MGARFDKVDEQFYKFKNNLAALDKWIAAIKATPCSVNDLFVEGVLIERRRRLQAQFDRFLEKTGIT